MALASPTKNGDMQEDKYWILKYGSDQVFDNPYVDNCKAYPVECVAVKFEVWRMAPVIAKSSREHRTKSDTWIGRRINDEVELFDDEENEEEFRELRKDIEMRGLTVRSFVEQSDQNKFPKMNYKAIMGCSKNTLMKKIVENLEEALTGTAIQNGAPYDYGFLTDFPNPSKGKTLGIVRVDMETFQEIKGMDEPTIRHEDTVTKKETDCKVIGEIRECRPSFCCEEEIAKSYFNSIGVTTTVEYVDKVAIKERKEKEEALILKKQAKKHRRQVTGSTLTSTSESSFYSLPPESEVTAKARQRERSNTKRKAQQQRRRVTAMNSSLERTINITSKNAGDQKKYNDENTMNNFHFVRGLDDNRMILKDQKGQLRIKSLNDLQQFEPPVNITFSKDHESEIEKYGFAGESSSSASSTSSEEDANGLKVIEADTTHTFTQALSKATGPLMILSPTEAGNGLNFQYLTRGL